MKYNIDNRNKIQDLAPVKNEKRTEIKDNRRGSLENIPAYELDSYIKKIENEILLVDVRDKEKYHKRHITGAVNISHREIMGGKVSIAKDKLIFVYCDRGGLSLNVGRYLEKNGYNVINLVGGINNYRGKNLYIKSR